MKDYEVNVNSMLEIKRCQNSDRAAFTALVIPYFRSIGVTEPLTRLEAVAQQMVDMGQTSWGWLWLAELEGQLVGFIEAQIDNVQSDWNLKPGWGFIRETYVAPAYRGQGIAHGLVAKVEATLRANGIRHVYLTTDEAMTFWAHMGYEDTGTICPRNDGFIFSKVIC